MLGGYFDNDRRPICSDYLPYYELAGKTYSRRTPKNYIEKYTNIEIVGASFMGKSRRSEKEESVLKEMLGRIFVVEEKRI